MKLGIKYCMIVLLALLLHHGAAEAMSPSCVPSFNKLERCTLSQGSITQQAVRNFYNRFPAKALCLDHVDTTHVPTNKCILLLTNHLWMEWQADSSRRRVSLPSTSYIQSDPHTYYIFGLRKIII